MVNKENRQKTVGTLIKEAERILQKGSIPQAGFEARQLVMEFARLTREQLFLERNRAVEPDVWEKVCKLARERLTGTPLQYLLGSWEFYGYSFQVGEGVLIPRADTETLIDAVRPLLCGEKPLHIADLCSGTGCIAITLAHCFPQSSVYAVEYEERAYGYLKENCRRHGLANVMPVQGDVLAPDAILKDCLLDAVVSNPPYIPKKDLDTLQEEVKREPRTALNGGEDGLAFYRGITRLWTPRIRPGGLLAYEIGFDQSAAVEEILRQHGYREVKTDKDLAGNDRVVLGFRPV